jgi:putative acetyltransferase
VADITIALDDPARAEVHALLGEHLTLMHELSPPEDVHALHGRDLCAPDISFFSARADGELLAVGALRMLGGGHAEIKSMHTARAARSTGVGTQMLQHLLKLARDRGVTRVSLETGTMDAFAPARRLYERFGFRPCPPFGEYFDSPNSVCMTLVL